MRRILRILAIAVLWIGLATPQAASAEDWKRAPLRIALEKLLSWNLMAEVKIGAIEGPLIPELRLRDVTIDVDGARFASIDVFALRVNIGSLLEEERPIVGALALEGAHLRLVEGPDGQWEMPARFRQDASAPPESSGVAARWIRRLFISEIALRKSRLEVESEELSLSLGIDLSARDIALPWRAPDNRKVAGEATFEIEHARVDGQEVRKVFLDLALADGRLKIAEARGSTVFGEFEFAAEVEIAELGSAEPHSIVPEGSIDLKVAKLEINEEIVGDLRVVASSDGEGTIRLDDLKLEGGFRDVRLDGVSTLIVSDELVSIRGMKLLAEGQILEVEGGVTPESFHDLSLKVVDLDVARAGVLADLPVPMSGRLDASLKLEGPFSLPAIEGMALWREPTISSAKLDRVELELRSGDDELRGTVRLFESDTSVPTLLAEGARPYRTGSRAGSPSDTLWIDPLSLAATRVTLVGEAIDLGIFEPFATRQVRELGGRVDVSIGLSGGTPPVAEGELRIADGAVRIPLLGRTFGPINGTIELSGRKISLEKLHVGAPEAGGYVTGNLEFEGYGLTTCDLRFEFNQLPIARSSVLRANLAGRMTVRGSIDALEILGDLTLDDTGVRVVEERDPVWKEIRILARSSPGADESAAEETNRKSALESARVDLNITIPDSTRVRGRGADIRVAGTLNIRKAPLAPFRYSGRVAVQRGSYSVHSRKFRIRKGVLTLNGGTEIDPVLDIEGAYRVKNVTIVVYLTERASSPMIRLAGEPEMEEADVLSYLLVGRPRDANRDAKSANAGGLAANLAAGVALSELTEAMGERSPVDVIELEIDGDGSDDRVGVGKYLGNDVFVRYDRTLGRNPVDSLHIELRLTEHWSLESQVSNDENAGADVIWSTDF